MASDDNSTHQNTGPVQIVRLEAGNGISNFLHICVGLLMVMALCIAASVWAVSSAIEAQKAMAEYRDAAEREAVWRQRMEANLVAHGFEVPNP